MVKDEDTPFFDGFDLPPDDKPEENPPENDKIPALPWLSQMLLKLTLLLISHGKTAKHKETIGVMAAYLVTVKDKLNDAVTKEKREDYEAVLQQVGCHIMDFRIYLNAVARVILRDNESVEYLFLLCSKMEKKLYYMTPIYERPGGRKHLSKTLKVHFGRMPECARKYYIGEIKALEEIP